MRILLTGNLGYIGTELTALAKARGHYVRGFDAGFYDDCLLYKPEYAPDDQVRGDIRDIEPDLFAGIDAVIHLAALSNDPICELDPKLTFEINHVAAVRCAKFASQSHVPRFIFASSASVYGVASATVSEESKVNPLTAYAESKYLAEKDLFAMADDDFVVSALRPATAYGLGARLRTDIVLNNLCAWAHCEGKIKIMSDGTPLRPAAHVRDIAKAFLAAAQCSGALVQRQVFNVGRNEDNYSIRQMAETVRNFVPQCELVFTGEHTDSRSYAINFDKIASRLGSIAPLTTTMLSGVEELVSGYKKHGLTHSDFTGGTFTRLSTLKRRIDSGEIAKDLRWNSPRQISGRQSSAKNL